MKNTKYKIIEYGLNWQDIPDECDPAYNEGSLDTVAHQLACIVSQDNDISVATSDIKDYITFGMKETEIEQAVKEFLQS
jgi:hypothetical protein